jgi:hypothetical protein
VVNFLTIALLLFFFNANIAAQTIIQCDTAFVSSAQANIKKMYAVVFKEQTQLCNGGDYVDYRPLKDEHPYFISDDWITGTIQYDNEAYDSVSLLYNIYTDHVIAEQSPPSIMVQLIRDKVQSFSIDGHTFIFFKEGGLPTGYYDQLCNGKITLYAKRIKEFRETISSSEIERDFSEKSKYYIGKDGHYYSIRNKKSVLNVLGDRKREINQFIRQNHLHFSKARELAIIRIAQFYNGK